MNYKFKLKEARKKKGLTQQELADKLEIKQQNISQYERGIQQPSLETFIKIAKMLDLSIDDLIEIEIIHNQYSSDLKSIVDSKRKKEQ